MAAFMKVTDEAYRLKLNWGAADALLAKVIHVAEVKEMGDKTSEEMFSLKFEDYNALKAEMLEILSV